MYRVGVDNVNVSLTIEHIKETFKKIICKLKHKNKQTTKLLGLQQWPNQYQYFTRQVQRKKQFLAQQFLLFEINISLEGKEDLKFVVCFV